SALIETDDLDEAVEWANELGPEHLELHVTAPDALARKCRNAGAVFSGNHSPEPLGDYTAGPSHTLPTGGTARFFSPLSVKTFMKSQSFMSFSESGYQRLREPTEALASLESLDAHRSSVSVRSETE
ncbi:MAG: histidinol dehydrogenase, partial [bacterium]